MQTCFVWLMWVLSLTTLTNGLLPFQSMGGDWVVNVVITKWPRATVEAILQAYDPTLQLDLSTNDGLYPVIHMFGNQTNLKTQPPVVRIAQYLEYILSIPKVKKGSKSYTGTTPILYLDNLEAVVGGQLFYGFPKTMATMAWQPQQNAPQSRYNVSSEHDKTKRFITADFQITGPSKSYDFYKTELGELLQLFNFMQQIQPAPNDQHYCSVMDVKATDSSIATYTPLKGRMNITQEFIKNVPTGSWSFDDFLSNPLGAFQLKTHWALSAPWQYCDNN